MNSIVLGLSTLVCAFGEQVRLLSPSWRGGRLGVCGSFALVQLIDSGATKQQGVVKKMTHDYGFLQSLSSSDTVYFNTADVVQSREGERLRVGSQVLLLYIRAISSLVGFVSLTLVVVVMRWYTAVKSFRLALLFLQNNVFRVQNLNVDGYVQHPLRPLSQAEFWVVPDRTKNRESFRALEVQILPPGTLVLEEETHKKLRGTVERAPTLPQRQGFREGMYLPCASCCRFFC